MTDPQQSAAQHQSIERIETYAAHNYHPLPVAITSGSGAWLTDVDGNRYLDFLSAYSAVNFGHCNPHLVQVATEQLGRLAITSRAVYADNLGPFLEALTALCGKQMALPMNTGVEAVESGLKIARKWGYQVKGVPEGAATIIVMDGNFHGRTISVVSFSSDSVATNEFGPFTPGFVAVPFGDLDALAAAIDETTVAILVEPIQGEAGVITPPPGYLAGVRELATRNRVLMIADEIQSGLGRTGTTFYCEQAGVVPDLYLLGKALGVQSCRSLPWSVMPRSWECCVRANTDRPSAGIRWQRPSGWQSSNCCRPARCRPAPASSAPTCTAAFRPCWAMVSPRCGESACGPVSTSTRGWAQAAISASVCWPKASLPRTPTGRHCGWRRRWSSPPTSSISLWKPSPRPWLKPPRRPDDLTAPTASHHSA